jgi:hypothetical protein
MHQDDRVAVSLVEVRNLDWPVKKTRHHGAYRGTIRAAAAVVALSQNSIVSRQGHLEMAWGLAFERGRAGGSGAGRRSCGGSIDRALVIGNRIH